MKLFNLFKRKNPVEVEYDLDDFKQIKKKDRKRSLKLLNEYKRGLVIQIDKDVDQKHVMDSIRKGI